MTFMFHDKEKERFFSFYLNFILEKRTILIKRIKIKGFFFFKISNSAQNLK